MALAGSLRRLASGAVRRPRQCGLMTAAQAEFFERSGYVKVPGALTKSDVGELRRWVDEIASWPEVEDAWVHHFERGRAGSNQLVLSRTENFFPFHAGMARFLSSGVPAQLAGDALREEASLYKEKINYKVPGGGGYTAHQDAPAYAESDCHVTCLVTLDEAGLDNGCLEFSAFPWQRKELIGLTKEGVISDDVAASLDFEAVPTEPGDALVFSSYVPHRSAANTSSKARNLLYLTYNRKSAGDLRSQYYHNRRATMHAGRVSTIGHFQGSVAEDDDLALAPRTRASTPSKAREEIIAKIAKLFEDRGGSRYDSFSTQSEHARMTALMAMRSGALPPAVVAAFLHDIGHLLLDEHAGRDDFLLTDKRHEEVGYRFLCRSGFPAEVTELVRLHVEAKRYLCAAEPSYYAGLSSASQQSLALQGGPLSPEGVARWTAASPHAAAAGELRRWEDAGKRLWAEGAVAAGELPAVEALLEATRSVLLRQGAA